MIEESKYRGCFKGLAIGDSSGAFYEGGPVERLLWRLIGQTRDGKNRFTDDTQMSIDVAQSFLETNGIDQDHLAQKFASSYKWSRGYGPSAARLLKGIKAGKDWRDLNRKKYKQGSIGNGAAMRAPIVALCHPLNDEILKENIRLTSEITHASPLAIEGAYIIALTTSLALNDTPIDEILAVLQESCELDLFLSKLKKCVEFLNRGSDVDAGEIRRELGNGIVATDSCVTSIYFALRFRHLPIDPMLKEIFEMGGDTDTIAAMAGAIWGAFNGDSAMDQLAKDIESINFIEQLSVRLHKINAQ